jgi:hypothetical protein
MMEERTTPAGTTQGERARFWLTSLGSALLLMLLFAVLAAAPADAEPRIKTSGCKVYDTNRVDPIAFSAHLHHHFGNTSTSNSSTGESLLANKSTSCRTNWFTSAAWFPVAKDVSVDRIAVYYRAPGDQTRVQDIPLGLKLLTHEAVIRTDTVTMHFPDCVRVSNGSPVLDSSDHNSHLAASRNGVCPSTHPYRIPRISFLIQYAKQVSPSTLVSMGVDEWAPMGQSMHADYFAANQPVFNDRLIDLCLRNAKDSQTVAHPDCGEGP